MLWVGRERKAATLEGFFDWFGTARSAALYFVCSDMWKPYLKVVAERAGQAVHVLDRFHIMSHYMDAFTGGKVDLGVSGTTGCSSISGLFVQDVCLLAPMESADPRLILLTGFSPPWLIQALTGRDLACVPSHLVVPCATSFGEPARVVNGRTSSFRPNQPRAGASGESPEGP